MWNDTISHRNSYSIGILCVQVCIRSCYFAGEEQQHRDVNYSVLYLWHHSLDHHHWTSWTGVGQCVNMASHGCSWYRLLVMLLLLGLLVHLESVIAGRCLLDRPGKTFDGQRTLVACCTKYCCNLYILLLSSALLLSFVELLCNMLLHLALKWSQYIVLIALFCCLYCKGGVAR